MIRKNGSKVGPARKVEAVSDEKNVVYGLSCMCHPEAGIRYVGQTSTGLRTRMYHHKHKALTENAEYPVSRWIRKHGWGNIQGVVLSSVDNPQELDALEERWIEDLQVLVPGGLNLWPGGNSARGYKWSEESLQRRLGKKPSAATRAKLSAYGKSLKGSETNNAKITEATAAEIKRLAWEGLNSREISEATGVSRGIIWSVLSGKNWSHVPDPGGERKQWFTGKFQPGETAGENHRKAKLTEKDVLEIRRRFDSGERQKDIAPDYPFITKENLGMVCRRKTWKHLP